MREGLKSILIGLLTVWVVEQAPRLATTLLKLWSRLLQPEVRERMLADWHADLATVDGQLSKLGYALQVVPNIPGLWQATGWPMRTLRMLAHITLALNALAFGTGAALLMGQSATHTGHQLPPLAFSLTHRAPLLLIPLLLLVCLSGAVEKWRERDYSESISVALGGMLWIGISLSEAFLPAHLTTLPLLNEFLVTNILFAGLYVFLLTDLLWRGHQGRVKHRS